MKKIVLFLFIVASTIINGQIDVMPLNFWKTSGNAISTNTNFIGTTTNYPFTIKTNNSTVATFSDGLAVTGSLSVSGKTTIGSTVTSSSQPTLNVIGTMSVSSTATISGRVIQNGLGSSTFFGTDAGLNDNLSNRVNSAFGVNALKNNVSGSNNCAFGYGALTTNAVNFNTAFGYNALTLLANGAENTAIGYNTLQANLSSAGNTALGSLSLFNNTGGSNTGIGKNTLYDNTSGQYNTAIGWNSGRGITTGQYNTIIGAQVTGLTSTLSNNIILADGQGNVKYQWDGTKNNIIGTMNVSSTATLNGLQLASGGYSVTSKGIDVTTGDAATINSPIGRFRKDATGSAFTLTNSFITANSIILLTFATEPGALGQHDVYVVSGAGSAVINWSTAPNECDVNFMIMN